MYSQENIRQRIGLIADGIPLMLESMTIHMTDPGKLLVTGWTRTIHFNNISKEKLLQELYDLKSSFSDLSKSFTELNDIIKGNDLTLEYQMVYDDSGKAGIRLCSEIEGKVNWYLE